MSLENKLSELDNLVELFKSNYKDYTSNRYDEANTRTDFIDKFFALLDWDISNSGGFSELYREVIREDRVVIEGRQKAPDYSFRIGGNIKFFVEAKKPGVNLKNDIEPAFQVRRYAYTAKLPLSILTDFEEFAVYDTRIKPDKKDKASVARIFYCTYCEFVQNFQFIYNIFSKNAILKGSFDKYVDDSKSKKGTSEVDKELLELVEGWRTLLAKNIALRNPNIDIYALNSAVQKIIDRIIFLRIAEDKEIEDYGILKALTGKKEIYKSLCLFFQNANEKYNSGLFAHEEWLEKIKIDDKVFISIIKEQYYPDCPYEFSVLPIDILGNIYEQFLGKTIHFKNVKNGHTVEIEQKPEVRKAGGVFYTPQFIVEYIIQKSISSLVLNKKIEEIKKLKICDPACGSGSFLVGAYNYLINFYFDYYTNSKNLKDSLRKGKIYQISEHRYRLSIDEKRNILLDNIYGVDIDPQAVEVTKLSLYLKLLEDEGIEAKGLLFKNSDLKVLPTLDENIKCGNSLISHNYYDDKNMSLFSINEMRTVNAFDWRKAFPTIFRDGGFDVIIGNPPYTYIISNDIQKYLKDNYKYQDYQKDLYLVFLEKYHYLLKENGIFGVIVSNTWLQSITYIKIREYLSTLYQWNNVLICKDKVFSEATVDTCVLIFTKTSKQKNENIFIDMYCNNIITELHTLPMSEIKTNGKPINILYNMDERKLARKIIDTYPRLDSNYYIYNGIKPFEKGKGTPPQTEKIMKEKPYVVEGPCPGDEWKPLFRGSLIKRFQNLWDNDSWVLYGPWLAAPRNPQIFGSPEKVFIRQTGDTLISTYISSVLIGPNKEKETFIVARNNMHIILSMEGSSLLRLIGIINSKLMDFIYTWINPEKGEALAEIKKEHVCSLPIPIEQDGENLSVLVEQILNVYEKIKYSLIPNEKNILSMKAKIIEGQIDKEVYKIYALNQGQIDIIEKK